MAKKKKANDSVWFELRLEKPLQIEVGGDLIELRPGKNKTITDNIELVREAQRLGAEVKVLSKEILDEIGDVMEFAKQGFKVISKAVQEVKKENTEEPEKEQEQAKQEEPSSESSELQESEEKEGSEEIEKPEGSQPTLAIKDLLKVDISKLSEEEKAKLRELLGE